MIDIIKNALKEAEIKTWRINEKKEHTAEVFFIRRRQDMRRIRDTHKYNVEVFCDYEKDGKPMRRLLRATRIMNCLKNRLVNPLRPQAALRRFRLKRRQSVLLRHCLRRITTRVHS